MAYLTPSARARRAWEIARTQHGVIALFQLMELGYTLPAVKHRIAIGRLHPIYRGVYAVGRRDLTRLGEWMAAVLACGDGGVLSHHSAAALWKIRKERARRVHVSVPRVSDPRHPGVRVHRCSSLPDEELARRENIPVTTPIRTLLDLGTSLAMEALEAAINEADKLELVGPAALRSAVEGRRGQRGVRPLRKILDRGDFVLTDSELERRFLPIARAAGLGVPLAQQHVNGFRVDFYWPDLGLVVETDGLRYHRTASQQMRDRVRDQAHIAAGLTALRFTHWQVRYDAGHVKRTLRATARRCTAPPHLPLTGLSTP
jgi:very-short-patch-repair endonuclease